VIRTLATLHADLLTNDSRNDRLEDPMKRPALFVLGSFMLLLGGSLLAWIGYNLFVEMQPSAEGKNPVVPTILGVGIFVGGVYRTGQAFGFFSGSRDDPRRVESPRSEVVDEDRTDRSNAHAAPREGDRV